MTNNSHENVIEFNIKNPVYDSQRDNPIDPNKTCFPTSVSTNLRTLEDPKNGGQGREEILRSDQEEIMIKDLHENRTFYTKIAVSRLGQWAGKYLPRYLWGFWVWYINNRIPGYAAEHETFNQEQIREWLWITKKPIVIGTKLTGRGGHVIMITGFYPGGFVCNDPFGNANYNYNVKNGKQVKYKYSMLPKKTNVLLIT